MLARLHSLLCLLILAFWPGHAPAETRALLVGVGDYTHLDADLKGPPADVALMAEVLAMRGVTDIRRLATGGAAPTRAAILAAMVAVSADAVAGDTVVFYFSGHGAQAPDASGDEGGGYDEILLAADATGWKGSIGAVENALLDDELQAWAQGLLARDVQVIGLIDACHSATGFRAMGGAGVPRGLDAAALGMPDDAPSPPGSEGAGLTGAFVFLYSSQSDQRSFEYPLGDGSAWHGEFTLRLAEVLRRVDGATWAQVLRATSDAMVQGPARQVPDGEGPMLQAGVFGQSAAPERFAVLQNTLQAGLLQGLDTGAEVAFFATVTGGAPLGTAVLTKVTAREARLATPAPEGALWAEVITPAPPPVFALGAPVKADDADYTLWLAALAAHPTAQPPGTNPDLMPILVGGGLALAGPDAVLDPDGPGSSPRVLPQEGETEAAAVARVLETARHALRLRRVFASLAGRSLTGKPALEVSYERRPAAETCDRTGPAEPVDPAHGLRPCDQLWLRFANVSGSPVDVSVLYFNADFTVTPIWPKGLSNRLMPGESARAGLQIAPDLPPATEELLVLAVPVTEDGERVDLTRLVTPDMTRSFASAASGVESWFEDRIRPAEDETARGFSRRPAALLMVRQVVRVTGPAP